MTFQDEYSNWQNDPDGFWLAQSRKLEWYKQPTSAYSEDKDGQAQWFVDGEINTCFLALDHHVNNGRSDQLALIYDSPVTGNKISYSFAELLNETIKVADMLIAHGVTKGDTVIIYMPMIPQAVMAMLACARIGAIHSVVFGGFAAPELASRIDDAKPKIIMTASCGIEVNKTIHYMPLVNEAIKLANHKIESCIVYQREEHQAKLLKGRDIDWQLALKDNQYVNCVNLKSTDPLYILYTSGTTGKPKGVVRDNGGHATALNYSMKAVYGMQAGDVFWSASDIGWVVGHSYIVYAPLISGCTTILYEGKPILTPDAGAFWRVVEEYQVNSLFSAPTAFRAIRREDPNGEMIEKHDLSSLKHVFTAGERLDPSTQTWMTQKIGVDVIDNWWQTETGWPVCSNLTGIETLPIKHGSATKPVPGYEVHILDEEGNQMPVGEQGKVAIKLPLPPSCLSTIWNDFPLYQQKYLSEYPGYYASGDGGYYDQDGYLFIMGRVDDVINVAGHRLSTGDLEEVISNYENVAECAVVAVNDTLKGQLPVGFVVLTSSDGKNDISSNLICSIRSEIGAIACYEKTYIVQRLPKTRSGKILRKVLKAIINNESYDTPPTIEDPAVLIEIKEHLNKEIQNHE